VRAGMKAPLAMVGARLVAGEIRAAKLRGVQSAGMLLSARELGVLEVLMLRSGRVVNKEQLAEQLYGWDEEVGANAIEVYVHRLRKKLEPAGVTIRTIRGLGYLLEKPGHD